MVLCLFLLTLSGAAAEEKEKTEGEVEATPEIRGYITVQLLSMSVPFKSRRGRVGRGPMTAFVVVRGQKNVEKFCNYLPRVREAITISIDQNPIPFVAGNQVLLDVGGNIQSAINRALPAPLVIRLHLFPVSRHLGKNAEVLELTGTGNECLALKEMPLDLEAILKGKKNEVKSISVGVPKTRKKSRKVNPPPPVESLRAPVGQKAITVNKVKNIPTEKGSPVPKQCRPLKETWPGGFHKASGALFWLDKAFTLDEDDNGAVDNVGFVLKSEKRLDLYIYYFPGPGRQSVISVPSLKLTDDREVSNICFGKVSYEKPKEKNKEHVTGANAPVPARETAEKSHGKKEHEKPVSTSNGGLDLTSGMGLVFVIAIGAGAVLILGGGIGYVFARRKADRRRQDRRLRKEKRGGERRKKNGPPEGPERRKENERRDDEVRRQKENRDQDEEQGE